MSTVAASPATEMSSADLYERYFAGESRSVQADALPTEAEVLEYVRYQIGEHYPEDAADAAAIAARLHGHLHD